MADRPGRNPLTRDTDVASDFTRGSDALPVGSVALLPVSGLRLSETAGWIATSNTPWFRLDIDVKAIRGLWLELSYRSSFYDRLIRPCLRFLSLDGDVDLMMAGPVFGSARWIGRVPKAATEVWISPTVHAGRFSFEVGIIRVLTLPQVAASTLRADVKQGLLWMGARSVGLRKASGRALRHAQTTMPFEDYDEWRNRNLRALDIAGIDRPRFNWRRGPSIRLALVWSAERRAFIEELLGQLRQQPYPLWSLALIAEAQARLPAFIAAAIADKRVLRLEPDADLASLASELDAEALIGRIEPGERLWQSAIPALAECAFEEPDAHVIYADEDHVDAHGRMHRPLFKPDWSPVFAKSTNYLGHAIFVRARLLRRKSWDMSLADFVEAPARAPFFSLLGRSGVAHLRRVVLSRPNVEPVAAPLSRSKARPKTATTTARATIIIPNKERVQLLADCIASLAQTQIDGGLDIVIVDNGSTSAEAATFYAGLKNDKHTQIVYQPGGFNFSALCNAGAQVARASNLVFLNNDTLVREPGWLSVMLAYAEREDIGAVGAKLVYKTGRIQHAGIVVGMDGFAGHVGYKSASGAAGYLDRFRSAHEISAVTGACLAVERKKFEAVGGFDAKNLPVELSDVDLCLRLAERGWVTIFAPQAIVVHHESVSRGKSIESHKRYAGECAYFRQRWSHLMRDDPYFHPALSLDSSDPALG